MQFRPIFQNYHPFINILSKYYLLVHIDCSSVREPIRFFFELLSRLDKLYCACV